jgi:hypothetical protein
VKKSNFSLKKSRFGKEKYLIPRHKRCFTTYVGSSATQAMFASWRASIIADIMLGCLIANVANLELLI